MTRKRRLIGFAVVVAMALVGIYWYSAVAPDNRTPLGVVVFGESDEARIEAALQRIDSVRLSEEGCRRVAERMGLTIEDDGCPVDSVDGSGEGRVLTDSPERLEHLPAGIDIGDLFAETEIMALLRENDESAAADAMIEAGVRLVLLHSEISPSLDRNGKVLNRLYHHDELHRFQLFRVGEGLLYYQVLEAPLAFPPQLATGLMRYSRARLSGQPVARIPDIPSENNRWTLMVVLRGQGRELAIGFGHDESIHEALAEALVRVESHHRRTVEILGFPRLSEHIADLRIEVHRVVERAEIEPREDDFLSAFWEMGIDGAYMTNADGTERGYLPGAVAYTRTIRSADSFLRHAAQAGRMSERRPWRDPEAHLEVLRTIHYAWQPGLDEGEPDAIALMRGVPIVPMEAVTIEAAEESIVHSGDWYLANLDEQGRVLYKFWPAENRISNEYNLVRHTLATWNLVQAYEMDPSREDFLEGARRALNYTQRFLETETVPGGDETMAYYSFDDNQKLGTVVVNMLGMIALAEATDDRQWDEQLRQMARFVLFMQNDEGSFDGYYVDEDHPYYGQKNDIVPGEAALALITLAEYFDDDSWISTLDRYWNYYRPWWDERVERQREGAPWPAYTYRNEDRLELVQFGPWTVMAAYAYYERTGDLEVADFGLEIARWMLETYQWDAERAPFQDYVGGYYKLPGELPAMQAFCYAEGTAAAYLIALAARPEQAAYFGERTRQTVRFGLQVQLHEGNSYAFSRPEQVDGGTPYAMNETKVRIDYVHHALSATYQWVLAAREDENLDEALREPQVLRHQYFRRVRALREQQAETEAEAAAGESDSTIDAVEEDFTTDEPISGSENEEPEESTE